MDTEVDLDYFLLNREAINKIIHISIWEMMQAFEWGQHVDMIALWQRVESQVLKGTKIE